MRAVAQGVENLEKEMCTGELNGKKRNGKTAEGKSLEGRIPKMMRGKLRLR